MGFKFQAAQADPHALMHPHGQVHVACMTTHALRTLRPAACLGPMRSLPAPPPPTPPAQIMDGLFERDVNGSIIAFSDMMKKQIVMPAHLMDDNEHEGKTGRNLFAVRSPPRTLPPPNAGGSAMAGQMSALSTSHPCAAIGRLQGHMRGFLGCEQQAAVLSGTAAYARPWLQVALCRGRGPPRRLPALHGLAQARA